MILGTAGHIDHGKTALVRALTGVDTDRLPEEKRRGITIDLGFAPLRLPGGATLGVVDVPGHEAFVRTMLAGATGIDMALIVIAADEGPMPQTREHLAILELLDVREAVVAVTKRDLVDAEWLALVADDIRDLLSNTPLAAAEIVATSSVTGEGVDELLAGLARIAERLTPRTSDDLFRLPVDRAFSVRGTGTVVTGTVWSGSLSLDDTVRVMPAGGTARIRGLQTHGSAVERIGAGERAAVALAGVEPNAVRRGSTLVRADWQATVLIRADLTMLADAPVLRPRSRVRFHLGTSDVGARVVAAGSPVSPGSSRAVRVVLDEPVVARAGDRFVLRSASPLATIGGGVVTDPYAPRRARPMTRLALSAAKRLQLFANESGMHGVAESSLPVRLGISPAAVDATVKEASGVERIADRLYGSELLAATRERLLALVSDHHAHRPLDTGAPRQEIASRLQLDSALFDHLVSALKVEGRLEASGAELRVARWAPGLEAGESKVADEIIAALEQAGAEPPSVSELQARFGPQTHTLLRFLEREGRVVQVEDARYYAPAAVRDLLQRLEEAMAGKGQVAPTDLREVLGFSRKYLIPFLEFCDRRGYTARQDGGRVWRGTKVG